MNFNFGSKPNGSTSTAKKPVIRRTTVQIPVNRPPPPNASRTAASPASAAATTIQGSGWAVLAYEPAGGNLVIEQFYDQQNGVPVATIPLFQLDMWEHAFYLDYQNVKPDYVKAWWNVVNWEDVAQRLEKARAGASSLV